MMELPIQEPGPEAQTFAYTSLDLTKRSIRLLRILPAKSQEGYIQCEIRHASIDCAYTCLSYVWGEPSHNVIKIDGQLHSVRDNLLAFLEVAHRKPISKWLWIDAICIDQINVAERTHQVQQMSHIYANAEEVISWLGNDRCIANFLRYAHQHAIMNNYVEALVHCDYWKRAWVTQEIFLARQVTLMAANIERPLEDLPAGVRCIPQNGTEFEVEYKVGTPAFTRVWPECFMGRTQKDWRWLQGRSLVQVIMQLKDKRCVELHDLVYSALGICGEGSDLNVDYERTVEMLAVAILYSCKQSFCLCSAAGVLTALRISPLNAWPEIGIWQQIDAQMTFVADRPLEHYPRDSFGDITRDGKDYWWQIPSQGCCGYYHGGEPHVHYAPFPPWHLTHRFMLSIPTRSLCADLKAKSVALIVIGGNIVRLRYVSSRGNEHYCSTVLLNEPNRADARHLRLKIEHNATGCTIGLSIATLLWLKKKLEEFRMDQQYGEDGPRPEEPLSCCSRVEQQRPVLRLIEH
jgi:hypothetical protein